MKQKILKWVDANLSIQEFIQKEINNGWFVQAVIPENFYQGQLCAATIIFYVTNHKYLLKDALVWWKKLSDSEKLVQFEESGVGNGLLASTAMEEEILACFLNFHKIK